MKKREVELMILNVNANGEDAIKMKIYQNGTTCRYGVGGTPELGISGMSHFKDSRFFDPLIAEIPPQILETPIIYEERTPNGFIEYVMAFYGVSKNGYKGERAEWTKSTGIRIKIDQQSNFAEPIILLMDTLTMYAAELTNEWYFDVVMHSKYKALSSTLPKETTISQPKTEEAIHENFVNYASQMMESARGWSMRDFGKNKTYLKDGQSCTAFIQQTDDSFDVEFIPSEVNSDTEITEKKTWWKVW